MLMSFKHFRMVNLKKIIKSETDFKQYNHRPQSSKYLNYINNKVGIININNINIVLSKMKLNTLMYLVI